MDTGLELPPKKYRVDHSCSWIQVGRFEVARLEFTNEGISKNSGFSVTIRARQGDHR